MGTAILAYLYDAPMTQEHVFALQAHLRQWIWGKRRGERKEIENLREMVEEISSRPGLDFWLWIAKQAGLDPLHDYYDQQKQTDDTPGTVLHGV